MTSIHPRDGAARHLAKQQLQFGILCRAAFVMAANNTRKSTVYLHIQPLQDESLVVLVELAGR
jgi:hypothetical protein